MKRGREDIVFGGGAKRPLSNMPRPGQAPPGQMHRLTTNDALSYLREVKNRFADKKEVYDTFLEIMKEFKAQRIDTSGVIIRVKDLFRGHKELVLGFNTFLPKGYEIQLADVADMDDDEPGRAGADKVPVEFDQAINYVNKIKTRFAQDERVYKAFLEILNMYRKGQKTITNVYDEVAVLFRNHSDLLTEFTFFLPDNSPPGGGHPLFASAAGAGGGGGARMGQRNWAPGKPGAQGRMVVPGRPGDRGGFGMGGMNALNKRKSVRPGEFGRGFDEDMRGGQTLQKELMFFDRVKNRLRNREAYQDFLKCLNLFATEIITRNELLNLVTDIIGRHADLMAGFTHFLNRCETMDSFDAELKAIAAHTKMGGKELVRMKGQTMREKFLSKPISELAADMCSDDRCTTSYVRVPPGYPKLRCSGRTALGDEVLNDTWVSIISGSEDYSFKLMRKNQYEEALFRCEDDRYELDMCIETTASTIRALRPVVDHINILSSEERAVFRLDEQTLSPVHYRAVERLYDQQGPQMVELLKKNPCVSVPVVLIRLEQKDAEWRKVREEMNKLWRKVFEQNYHKSLDHRSFYFKQADKKGLLPKTMLAEVREAADKRRADDRMLKSLAVGCPLSEMLQPDLSYEFPDRQVFDDVFLVTMYAVEEMLSTESKEAVAKFWLNMVEPYFGLPQREYTQLHAVKAGDEDDHKEDKEDDRKSSSSEQEEGQEGRIKREDGAESAGAGGGDAMMTDAAPTPEPGMTPEPPETAGLEALLAAGAAVDTEAERSNLGGDVKPDRGDTSADGPTARKEEEEDEGSDDEATTRFYALCKPLTSQANAAAAAATASSSSTSASSQVLYGNDQFYYFFRFHRYLYDRMCVAKRCAREKNQPQFRQTGEAPKPLDPEAAAAAREEAEKLHAAFMDMVRRLIDGGMDGSQFEDQCRTLLGTNSYVLFTLDKLIYKFVKHLQTMVADEATVALWELHKYERARSNGLISDEVYRANANMVLHDDNCYRFEYVQQANAEQQAAAAAQAAAQQQDARAATPPPDFGGPPAAAEASVLTVQLLEPDKSELPPTGLDPVFNDYINRAFLGSPAGANKHHVYLARNVAQPAAGAQVDEALMNAMSGIKIRNGLECKISCSNSKVSYVLDTEDVMYRKRRGHVAAFPSQRRTQQWAAFLSRRVEVVPPMREYTVNGVMPIGAAPLAPAQPVQAPMHMGWMHQ